LSSCISILDRSYGYEKPQKPWIKKTVRKYDILTHDGQNDFLFTYHIGADSLCVYPAVCYAPFLAGPAILPLFPNVLRFSSYDNSCDWSCTIAVYSSKNWTLFLDSIHFIIDNETVLPKKICEKDNRVPVTCKCIWSEYPEDVETVKSDWQKYQGNSAREFTFFFDVKVRDIKEINIIFNDLINDGHAIDVIPLFLKKKRILVYTPLTSPFSTIYR
jgi:hypothetical protein